MKSVVATFTLGVIGTGIAKLFEHVHPYVSDLAAIATIVATCFAAYASYRYSRKSAAEEKLLVEKTKEFERTHNIRDNDTQL